MSCDRYVELKYVLSVLNQILETTKFPSTCFLVSGKKIIFIYRYFEKIKNFELELIILKMLDFDHKWTNYTYNAEISQSKWDNCIPIHDYSLHKKIKIIL